MGFRAVLRLDGRCVGGQEAEEGEQRLPQEGPVVPEAGAGADQVREDAVCQV